MQNKKARFGTKAIHAGVQPDPTTGAIMTPIYQTSTYVQDGIGNHKGYEYSRTGNPTRNALENAIAELENGRYGMCFASGLSAIDAVAKQLQPGDEVICTSDLYGGTYRLFTKIFAKFGLKFHFIGMESVEKVAEYVNEKTRLIWIETPTNPMLNIIDIQGLAKLAKESNALLAVDNTFATPFLQRPLDLGADIVMHSVTKYLGGHSDVIMGALVCNDEALAEQLYFTQNASGAVPGPMDSFLVLRGLKTLHVRMQRHGENAEKIAAFLQAHPKVKKIYWPGLADHPNHDLAKRQMDGFGGMLSFTLASDSFEEAKAIVEKVEIFSLAESLGGVESLIGHPASMTHASIPKEEREKTGVVNSLIRLSVGIEDADDLIEDLQQALG